MYEKVGTQDTQGMEEPEFQIENRKVDKMETVGDYLGLMSAYDEENLSELFMEVRNFGPKSFSFFFGPKILVEVIMRIPVSFGVGNHLWRMRCHSLLSRYMLRATRLGISKTRCN